MASPRRTDCRSRRCCARRSPTPACAAARSPPSRRTAPARCSATRSRSRRSPRCSARAIQRRTRACSARSRPTSATSRRAAGIAGLIKLGRQHGARALAGAGALREPQPAHPAGRDALRVSARRVPWRRGAGRGAPASARSASAAPTRTRSSRRRRSLTPPQAASARRAQPAAPAGFRAHRRGTRRTREPPADFVADGRRRRTPAARGPCLHVRAAALALRARRGSSRARRAPRSWTACAPSPRVRCRATPRWSAGRRDGPAASRSFFPGRDRSGRGWPAHCSPTADCAAVLAECEAAIREEARLVAGGGAGPRRRQLAARPDGVRAAGHIRDAAGPAALVRGACAPSRRGDRPQRRRDRSGARRRHSRPAPGGARRSAARAPHAGRDRRRRHARRRRRRGRARWIRRGHRRRCRMGRMERTGVAGSRRPAGGDCGRPGGTRGARLVLQAAAGRLRLSQPADGAHRRPGRRCAPRLAAYRGARDVLLDRRRG